MSTSDQNTKLTAFHQNAKNKQQSITYRYKQFIIERNFKKNKLFTETKS